MPKGNTIVIFVERHIHGRQHLTNTSRNSIRCVHQLVIVNTLMVQDGEGDGDLSRKGTSVVHSDQQFREEVMLDLL